MRNRTSMLLTAAVLALGVSTGCTPLRPLVASKQPISEPPIGEAVMPGASKDSPISRETRDSREFDIGPDLGKIPNSPADDKSTDSNESVNSGGVSLRDERPRQMPLQRDNPPIPLDRNHLAQIPPVLSPGESKILPTKAEEPLGGNNRPSIPTPVPIVEGKKPVDLPKIINGQGTSMTTPGGNVLRRAPNDGLFDPNCRTSPTAAGCLLNLGPNDSPVERAVELAKMLEVVDAENRNLQSRVKLLETTLESREKMLREDETEITKASQDLVSAKAELQKLREEFSKVKQKLKQVEKEDLETLKTIIFALEKLLDAPPP